MKFIITLPRGVKVDVFNLPEDFDEIVRKTFYEYTEGTAEDYRYCDKLAYIDLTVQRLNKSQNTTARVEEICEEYFGSFVSREFDIPEREDFLNMDFMEDCYRQGQKDARLKSNYGIDDHHIYEEVQKTLCRIITVVMGC